MCLHTSYSVASVLVGLSVLNVLLNVLSLGLAEAGGVGRGALGAAWGAFVHA